MRLRIRIRPAQGAAFAVASQPKYAEPQLLLRRPSRLREFPENLRIVLRRSRARSVRWTDPRLPFAVLPSKAVERQSALGSILVHTCVVAILATVIPWLFPKHVPTAAELAAEHKRRISWYYFSDELPNVKPAEEPKEAEAKNDDTEKRSKPRFDRNMRQLIESHVANADNDHQTIIQPDAPNIRLTEDVRVPNIVMWAGGRPALDYLPAPNVDLGRRLAVPDLPQQRPPASLDYLPAPNVDLTRSRLNVPNVARPAPQASLDYIPAPQVDLRRRELRAPNVGASQAQATLDYLPAPSVNLKGRALDVPNIARAQQQATLDYIPGPNVDVNSGRLKAPDIPRAPAQAAMDYLPAAPDVRPATAGGIPSVLAAGRPDRPSLDYIAAPNVALGNRAPAAALPGSAPQLPERVYLPAADARLGRAAPPLVPLGSAPPAGPPKTGKSVVALSVNPAPASGPITLPAGNRAGDFTVATASNRPSTEAESGTNSGGADSVLRIPGISISGGSRPPSATPGTPVVSAPASTGALPEPPVAPRARPDPNLVADTIARYTRPGLALPDWKRGEPGDLKPRHTVKRIYTAYISMPNMTSAAGSWVLKFSELVEHAPGDVTEIEPPVAVHKVDPVYDPDLMRDKVEGTVTLAAIIRHDGSVDSVRVLRGLNARLDSNAVAALLRWKFQPATREGVPVDLEATVQIPFQVLHPEEKKR